jgi:L-alanine-DL-glutamate epimerase-like enolase superfamily enzyme
MAGDNVEAALWNLRVPLVPPIHSPRGRVSESCLLPVFPSDDKGNRGAGYSSFRHSSGMETASAVACKLIAEAAPGLAGLLPVERQRGNVRRRRGQQVRGQCHQPRWNLAGKQAGVACADVWGRPAGRDSLGCYASALWLDKSPAQLIAKAMLHRRNCSPLYYFFDSGAACR